MKSLETAARLTRTFVFTHAPSPENIQRICGVQCMSESSRTDMERLWFVSVCVTMLPKLLFPEKPAVDIWHRPTTLHLYFSLSSHLSWLNYLPGQETLTHTQIEKIRDQVLFKAASIQYTADLQGLNTS